MIHTGSLESDAGRKIAKIEYEYDYNNNPVRIQFTNGIDKYQFDEGYCQASAAGSVDYFDSYYYDRDHLGNIRRVIIPDGNPYKSFVIQTMNYYPFGAEFCDGGTKSFVQNHKYNGKEFDHMHGLNTYDYGARQYNPVTGRWDRIDPHCEDYKDVSPYVYCHNNPVMKIDLDGKDDYYTSDGKFLGSNNKKTDYIYISDNYKQLKNGNNAINSRVTLPESDISAKALSKIFTDIVKKMGCDVSKLDGGQINVLKWDKTPQGAIDYDNIDMYGNCNVDDISANAYTPTPGNNITAYWGYDNRWMFETRSNIQNMLGVHEYRNHFEKGFHHEKFSDNVKLFHNVMEDPTTWDKTTQYYKESVINYRNDLFRRTKQQ